MLLQLTIHNFALIDELSLEFDAGLNVLTGETGAGKSIVIDALRLVLGERMEMSQIRDRSQPCVVEAVFALSGHPLRTNPAISPYLKEEDDCLILKREVTPEGRSKNYMNHQFVNLSQIKEVSRWLVDIHGPYDHQQIFETASHRQLVDSMAGIQSEANSSLLVSYRELYGRYAALLAKKQKMLDQAEGKAREIDLLTYQIQEIEQVNPEEGEEEALKEERIHLVHAEKLYHLTAQILNVLNQGESSISDGISGLYRDMTDWIRIDSKADTYKTVLDNLQIQAEELARDISGYQEKLKFDEDRLKEIDERLERLEWLGRKYGKAVAQIKGFLAQSKEKLDQLVNSESYQKDLQQEIESLLPELQKKADGLSRVRKKAGDELVNAVLKDLKDLGIRHAKFECRIAEAEFGPEGQDQLEFFLSPNAGESVKPLAQIASGGEAARLMLAIKHALASVDQIPTLIFDEIDSNVGGRLGMCVGQKLKDIACERQVLLITHLPQIASFASRHIKVKKWVQKGKTTVEYEILKDDARIQELAQMMSGEKQTAIAKVHAEEMLKTASQ